MFVDSKGLLWMTIERHGFYKYNHNIDKATYLAETTGLCFIQEDKKKRSIFIPADGSESLRLIIGDTLPPEEKRFGN